MTCIHGIPAHKLALAGHILKRLPVDLQQHILKFTRTAAEEQPEAICWRASYQQLFQQYSFDPIACIDLQALKLPTPAIEKTIQNAIWRASFLPPTSVSATRHTCVFVQYACTVFKWLPKLTYQIVVNIEDELINENSYDDEIIYNVWSFPLELMLEVAPSVKLWQAYWHLYVNEDYLVHRFVPKGRMIIVCEKITTLLNKIMLE